MGLLVPGLFPSQDGTGVSPFHLISFCLIPFRLTKMTYVSFHLKLSKMILKDNKCT